MKLERLFSVQEIEDRLKISRHVLRNWIKSGRGPVAYRTAGGHRRFRERDIIDWYNNTYITQKEG